MDKLNNSEDAKRLLQGLGLHIDESVVRQVVNVLSGKALESLYSLYATRPDKGAPVCGKGSVYKIKKLYDEGELEPYLAYLSHCPTVDEARHEQIKEAEQEARREAPIEEKPYQETPHKQKMREPLQTNEDGRLPEVREHWKDLAALADFMVRGDHLRLPAIWELPGFTDPASPEQIPRDRDGLEAIMFLKRNYQFRYADLPYHPGESAVNFQLYPYLSTHLKAEDSQWDARLFDLRKSLADLHRFTYSLAQRIRVEAEERTGLKHSYGSVQIGTLNFCFAQRVFEYALAGRLPTYGFPSSRKDDGVTLFGDMGILAWARNAAERPRLQDVHTALIKEAKEWEAFKAAQEAYRQAEGHLVPMKQKLVLVALRKRFLGICEVYDVYTSSL